jgi:hypothetical protein
MKSQHPGTLPVPHARLAEIAARLYDQAERFDRDSASK